MTSSTESSNSQSNGPIRAAYVTSLREIESEGVGGLIGADRDTLYALQAYRLNGHVPQTGEPVSQYLYHRMGQTYEISLIIADDDFVSPAIGSRLAGSGLASYIVPSSNWRSISDPASKAFAKAQYEWQAFQSKHLVHDFDIIISDSYRMLFGPTALEGLLLRSNFGLDAFQSMVDSFNLNVSPKVEVSLRPEDLAALPATGSSVSRNGFTIRHEQDATGHHMLALYTLPMAGLILNIHPANTQDLPGYTPTADAQFRHGLFRRIHSSENFCERDGRRFYRIPLRHEFLLRASDLEDLFLQLRDDRRIFPLESERERLRAADDLDGMTFLAGKEKQPREYMIRRSGGELLIFESEVSRASALFVSRTVNGQKVPIFADTSIERDESGRSWLVTPVDGERGRFLSKTGATLHYVDAGIDTGAAIHCSRGTPIRNRDTSYVASDSSRIERPSSNVGGDNRHRDSQQLLRERNYDTKARVVSYGLLSALGDSQMRQRIAEDRMARAAIRESSPSLAKASRQVAKTALRAPKLV